MPRQFWRDDRLLFHSIRVTLLVSSLKDLATVMARLELEVSDW